MVEPANKNRVLGARKKTLNNGRGGTAATPKNLVAGTRPTETGGHKSSANVKPVAVAAAAETKRKVNVSSQVTKAAGKSQTQSIVKSSAKPNAAATAKQLKTKPKRVPVSVPKAELTPAPKFVSKPMPISDFKPPVNVAPKRDKKVVGKPKKAVAANDKIRTAAGSMDANKKSVTFTFVSTAYC